MRLFYEGGEMIKIMSKSKSGSAILQREAMGTVQGPWVYARCCDSGESRPDGKDGGLTGGGGRG
jgi:hypothetical protein